ncbi:uncharacterized protein YukE [Arthrobacter pigmenti]|uniref:Uncharacterized protein YukE n=1 Tax=Arthrobacter pigmenti TaxID=271432 RepID=A0A846RMI3_9MICC|nr:WXG100 family type VII secretion target [Arthrobacter pigmenti]NJC21832.1 uncharacterized protein YukE [Arthrobacter pigmenti]
MSNITHGNNPEQMGQLAQLLTQKSEELNQTANQLTQQLANTGWVGPDSERFRGDWETHRAQLSQIAAQLQEVSSTVQRNRQDQEATSNN